MPFGDESQKPPSQLLDAMVVPLDQGIVGKQFGLDLNGRGARTNIRFSGLLRNPRTTNDP